METVRALSGSLCLAVLACLLSPPAGAQQNVPAGELLRIPGENIASHRDSKERSTVQGAASGALQVVGYAIERLNLGGTRQVEILGKPQNVTTDRAWRVRVYTSNLQVRSAPIIVWIGDKEVGRGIESEDLSSVIAITTDGSLVQEGKAVGLSYQSAPDVRLLSETPIHLQSPR